MRRIKTVGAAVKPPHEMDGFPEAPKEQPLWQKGNT